MNKNVYYLILIGLVALVLFAGSEKHAYNAELKTLAVQDAGRIKPFDTFAREYLELIYGKKKLEGKPAGEIVFTWMLQPEAWEERPLIEIRHHLVKRGLKLKEDQRHFKISEILSSDRLSSAFQELNSKRQGKERLDPYFQGLQRLEQQLYAFREIGSARLLRIVPPKEGETWLAPRELPANLQEPMSHLTKSFISALGGENKEAQSELSAAIGKFKDAARAENPALYNHDQAMRVEVHHNEYHPFRHAYIAYLLSALFVALVWILKKPELMTGAWVFAILGMLLNTYGFVLRVYLTERAPVTNMYETVVWVGYGTVAFAMIIERLYKWRFILGAGSAVGAFCLILADSAPAVLDATLSPLEPVLRDNFWLTTHVLIITISYAAFFLAFALGDIGLVMFMRDPHANSPQLDAIVVGIYRSIQIGVALLAPGIILGGIWADYSWGRFWGWDPKETWALIALLGYLAILHGRLVGWIKGFGMIASSIVTFSLVVMAWYGVNFVLGAGLHSYGFGAGGVEYVSAFVGIHILAVIFVLVRRMSMPKPV